MQNAVKVLSIISKKGKNRTPIERVYRLLFKKEFYLMAYQNLYANNGAMTAGSDGETVDGMSLKKIDDIIESLQSERYRWTPVRREYINKKNSNKKRPLGIPSWSDKLLQEVIKLILGAYYEPQFSDRSHGFRTNRGCQSALEEIKFKGGWKSVKWFIEGDIKGCFDNIDHDILINILGEKVKDNRLLRLLTNLLKNGYMEDWKYNQTLSGCPQGSVLSPLLANIYMDRLDKFVESKLIPRYTKGTRRTASPEYKKLQKLISRHTYRKEWDVVAKLKKEAHKIPSKDTHDENFRRLYYIRYADDWLMGVSGSKKEAEIIKQEIADFLTNELKLNLSKEKTLITHGKTQYARFLGYDIHVLHSDTKLDKRGQRNINGAIGLRVPQEVMNLKEKEYMKKGKPIHKPERTINSDYDIISQYQSEFRGFIQYYMMAYNVHRMGKVKRTMELSLMKTLANKYKSKLNKMYKKYKSTRFIKGKVKQKAKELKVIQVVVEREKKKPLIAYFGGFEIKFQKSVKIEDTPTQIYNTRSQLIDRLLNDTCELCSSHEKIQIHHVKKLKDLRKTGREQANWVKRMIAMNRKTLAVCEKCHISIHSGTYDGKKIG
ncbi:reverse transcriptase/maturase family protein [Priestia endophytica]|uniref:reverse transcriptase/maturase family protein n=1 Tax=Priestia endophytica TaxID=135735 RepID=UPI0022820225|nr:reverse transcriptase/maturase family protein [Priestia endophytica]MCY8234239.1 reverse transcriptase domain-containing protein [Priestia endophytica]